MELESSQVTSHRCSSRGFTAVISSLGLCPLTAYVVTQSLVSASVSAFASLLAQCLSFQKCA